MGKAIWRDISYDLKDLPATGVAYDDVTGDLYIATDFGVLTLHAQTTSWFIASADLPVVSVYNLTIASQARVLYAATHGRGAWRLDLA
jgi:hypothetical protein